MYWRCLNCDTQLIAVERSPEGLDNVFRCPQCGTERRPYDEELPADEDAFVEQYVTRRIDELFPPGSDGPPLGFDWGGLYMDAFEAWATKDVIDAPFPELPELPDEEEQA